MGTLPDQLREMPDGVAVLPGREIVLAPLVAPRLDRFGDVGVSFGDVLAVRTPRVRERAGFHVFGGVGGERVVPCHGCGVVLGPVDVSGIEDGGVENGHGCVLGGGWSGGGTDGDGDFLHVSDNILSVKNGRSKKQSKVDRGNCHDQLNRRTASGGCVIDVKLYELSHSMGISVFLL